MRPRRPATDGSPKVTLRAGSLRVENGSWFYDLDQLTAGLPRRMGFHGDRRPVFETDRPAFHARWNGRTTVRPMLRAFAPSIVRGKDRVMVRFTDIGWRDDHGREVPGFRLALGYEFHGDGVVFVTTFFSTDTTTPGTLDRFTLEAGLQLDGGQEANWAYWKLPARRTGAVIQDLAHFERNLTRKESRRLDGTISPFVSFDFGSGGRRDRHLEFFVESWNALTQEKANTATEVVWRGPRASLRWDFEKRSRATRGRGYQWRNIWGWCLRRFPVRRRRAPLRIFHWLDNWERYPGEGLVRRVAEQGANVLIVHEAWRLDMKNGELPHDIPRLARLRDACHRHGLALALYVRGNEDAIRKEHAAGLRPWLEYNRDGLYMDYGSPMCFQEVEEYAPGGRVGFREYHAMARKIREFVGPDGLYLSHSGSFFCALGHTCVDAYLGGEQEKGALLNNPTVHAYFSGLSVAPSSLWTAAFPTYRTARALPFLASTLQAPFLHLGTQFPYSSLSHPKVPSLVTFARPLWRLWELFDGVRNLRAWCGQGAEGLFSTDSPATGVSMMVAPNGDTLVIAANHARVARDVRVGVHWKREGLARPRSGFALEADGARAAARPFSPGSPWLARLGPNGVGGWLLVGDRGAWRRRLLRFSRPWVSAPREEQAHQRMLADIRARRFVPPRWDRCFLRVSVPNWPNTYEDSVWFELFENVVELLDLGRRGKPCRLGYVSQRGLVREVPRREEYLWPGTSTPWIPLRPGGPSRLGLATRRGKGEFYSLVRAEISPRPARCGETRELVYNNDLDLDWSLLAFRVR